MSPHYVRVGQLNKMADIIKYVYLFDLSFHISYIVKSFVYIYIYIYIQLASSALTEHHQTKKPHWHMHQAWNKGHQATTPHLTNYANSIMLVGQSHGYDVT